MGCCASQGLRHADSSLRSTGHTLGPGGGRVDVVTHDPAEEDVDDEVVEEEPEVVLEDMVDPEPVADPKPADPSAASEGPANFRRFFLERDEDHESFQYVPEMLLSSWKASGQILPPETVMQEANGCSLMPVLPL